MGDVSVESLRRAMQRASVKMRGKTGYAYDAALQDWARKRDQWMRAVKADVAAKKALSAGDKAMISQVVKAEVKRGPR